MAPVEAGVRGCQGACVSECDLCVCVGDRLGVGAGGGSRMGAAVAVRVAGRVWAGVAVGAAAVGAGVRAAVWWPGCAARRLGAGRGAGSSFAQSALPLSSPRRAASVCVCVLGVIPGDTGVTVTPAQAAAPTLPRAPTLGQGRLGSKGEAPGEGTGRARRLRPPTSRGRGCRLPFRSLLFGAPRLPLSPSSRPECQTGGGDEPTTPPSRFPWKPQGGDAAPPPPRAGLGELWGRWGPTPRLYLARPPPPDSRLPPALPESGGQRRARR